MQKPARISIGRYALPALLALALFFLLRQCLKREEPLSHPRDYAVIAREGILRATTEYNSIGFYTDGDTLAGFYYELIQAFARSQGLKAEITPLMSFDEQLEGLEKGEYDLIAYGIPTTNLLKDSLLFTAPILLSRQVLVQPRKRGEHDSLYVNSQLDLAQRTLYVVKGSPSILRIRNLENEMGDTIYIKEVEKYGAEQLIAMVAHGDIPYAVCDESIAQAAADSLPQIDISTAISFTQFYSWAVSKQSPVLLDSLDSWLARFKTEKEYQRIYRRYYGRKP